MEANTNIIITLKRVKHYPVRVIISYPSGSKLRNPTKSEPSFCRSSSIPHNIPVEMKDTLFKLLASPAWFLGLFPATRPVVKGLKYEFLRCHTVFVFSVLFWALYAIALFQYAFLYASGIEIKHVVYYEKALSRAMLVTILVADTCVRCILVFRSGVVVNLFHRLQCVINNAKGALIVGVDNEVFMQSVISTNRRHRLEYLNIFVAAFIYWLYVISRLLHYYNVSDFKHVKQFYFIPITSVPWYMIVYYLFQDLSHWFGMFFGLIIVFLLGRGLADAYEMVCGRVLEIRENFVSLQTEIPGNTNSYLVAMKPKAEETGLTVDKTKSGNYGVIAVVCQEFKDVTDCFEEYRRISGLLCVGLLLECTYDIFFCVKDIFVKQDIAQVSGIGAVAGISIFLTIVNVGERIETQIHKSQTALRSSRALHTNDDENSTLLHKLVVLENWILNWNWRLSAMNLFYVNRSLIISVLVAVLSYVMIVFQLRLTTTNASKFLECFCNESISIN